LQELTFNFSQTPPSFTTTTRLVTFCRVYGFRTTKNGERPNHHRHCSWCKSHHIRHLPSRCYRCRRGRGCDLSPRCWAHSVLLHTPSQASEEHTALSIWNFEYKPFFYTIDRNATVWCGQWPSFSSQNIASRIDTAANTSPTKVRYISDATADFRSSGK